MRSWRNWQTRKTKDLVGNSMQVQFLSTAPQKRKSHSRFPFLFCRRQPCEMHNYMQLTLHYISLFRRTSSSLHARNTANEEQLLYAGCPVFQRPALEVDSCRKYNSWTLVYSLFRRACALLTPTTKMRYYAN